MMEQIDLVGKDLLEQLMFSLYPNAETIYREYLQNACDSVQEAVRKGILSSNEGHVTITIDEFRCAITIEDNGMGIQAHEAEITLKSIARSKKKRESYAGFYGIGRLVGGGYCKKLIFTTSAQGETVASEMVFDMDAIRKILQDENDNSSASEVIQRVTTYRNDIKENPQAHYFKVELQDILVDYQDVLLNEEKIKTYLMQVAPLPYEAPFYNNLIKPSLEQQPKYKDYFNHLNTVKVSINEKVGIEKPYEIKFKGTEHTYTYSNGTITKDNAPIESIHLFSIEDPELGNLAWGWYAYTPKGTQIKESDPYTKEEVLTRSIRLRCHNIQVGGETLLDQYFKQKRSPVYFNGEVFIIHPKIKPTADRSDIAPTFEAKRFQTLLQDYFKKELEPLYQAANTVNKNLENLYKKDKEIDSIKASNELLPEQKKDKIAELKEEKKKQQKKIKTIIEKSKNKAPTSSMHTLGKKAQQAYNQYENNNQTPISFSSSHIAEKPVKTINEKIDELSDTYSGPQLALLRKVFDILDIRYMKNYEAVVRSMKASILNDLKK